jgi:hypothetical protein
MLHLLSGPALADSVVGNDPLVVDVLVLNYDPLVPNRGNRPVHSVLGWNDPRRLGEEFVRNIEAASGGFIDYNITEWRDLDEIPLKADGFQYPVEQYVANWTSGGPWHMPDTADYVRLLKDQGVSELVNSKAIDEVWLFGGPYFGYWESAMAGPDAFYINGGTYPEVESDRPFAVMGFNYERGDAEMLHSLGHRIESSVSRYFGGWNIHDPQSDWDRFTANAAQTGEGPFGVGSVHFPFNGRQDYDYENAARVETTAAGWLEYPDLTGAIEQLSSSTWGSSHLGYMQYWLDHLPDAAGLHGESGRVNNWWKYVYDWTSYNLDGTPSAEPVPEPSGACVFLVGGALICGFAALRRLTYN